MALEQEEGEVRETDEGPLETDGEVESQPGCCCCCCWDGGIVTADGGIVTEDGGIVTEGGLAVVFFALTRVGSKVSFLNRSSGGEEPSFA